MQRKIFILIGISVFILILDRMGLLNPIKNVAERAVVMPVSYVTTGVLNGLENNFRILTFWKSGELRIKNLEERNRELEGLKAKNLELQTEIELLKKQLNVSSEVSYTKLSANVIDGAQELVLDVGDNNKIKVGTVVFYLNYYIGRVYKVTPNRSFVELPTNSRSQIPVKIGTVRGTAVGQYNNSIILDKIGQEESILPDDLVLTTGDGDVPVANLYIGKVGAVKSSQSDLFKKFEIIPPIDYKKLDKVFLAI
ncbi:hypothetical protein A2872_01975 [Candidatus Gottesmanbacteria bacterium RIFCSPHIGHO2_01_FULL_42_12]|uniref:Cell shape-determining protein MreC n=1 Tax=Candidatus Gottesmanbacteria bacterium RIFCSPHIGHO2_01_FULL_42_12 TaxID=1798377 RepID=A0A1F5Z6B6_9BACT|nr:MAG: hypothetical protein A2872_01975 [Candidatus Gottesmanbacteria bacterium RIFCSPHIGHO2_01_FULL_42_12]